MKGTPPCLIICLLTTFFSLCFVLPVQIDAVKEENLAQNLFKQKSKNFEIKSRKVGGKKIAVVSFKLDPERGRRSILVPDAEGLLHPASFAHLRHPHRFLSPFEDEEQLMINKSLVWDKNFAAKEDEVSDEKMKKILRDIETSVAELEETLGQNKLSASSLESASLVLQNETIKKSKGENRKKKGKNKEQKKKKKKKKERGATKNKGDPENKQRKAPRSKMFGQEACQFKVLKKCAKKLKLLPKISVEALTDYQRCDKRKDFLECVEKRRDAQPCKKRAVARGNLPELRSWIKKLFWTSSSCLLNESMKGR